jgi:hypothetical protein
VAIFRKLEEVFVDGGVGGEFRVEGGGKDVAVLDKDGLALVFGEDRNSLPDFFDDGAADKNHFERLVGEGARAEENVARELATVTVAQNGHVEEFEGVLRGIFDVSGEQNGARAGAEDSVLFRKFADGAVQAFFLEELELGGGFAAGEDQTVAGFEVGNGADFDGVCAELAKAGGVCGEVTLDGEDTDFHGLAIRLDLVDSIFG